MSGGLLPLLPTSRVYGLRGTDGALTYLAVINEHILKQKFKSKYDIKCVVFVKKCRN